MSYFVIAIGGGYCLCTGKMINQHLWWCRAESTMKFLGFIFVLEFFFPFVFIKKSHESIKITPTLAVFSGVLLSLWASRPTPVCVRHVCATTVDGQTDTPLKSKNHGSTWCGALMVRGKNVAQQQPWRSTLAWRSNKAVLSSRMLVKHFCFLIKGHFLLPANWFS